MGSLPFAALRSHGRFDYSAITQRPYYRWPNGAGLAVYLGFNIEHFSFGEGLGAKLGPACPEPDVLNYAWRAYGNRVGAWRYLKLFDTLGLPAGVLANTALYHHCLQTAPFTPRAHASSKRTRPGTGVVHHARRHLSLRRHA